MPANVAIEEIDAEESNEPHEIAGAARVTRAAIGGVGSGGGVRGPSGSPEGDDDVVVEHERKVQRPKRYKVVFHNDDYTTREFVVEVLMRFFNKDESEATYIMLSVHHRGHGVAGVYPRDVAETKVSQVNDYARSSGFPLKVTAEPE